MARKVSYSNHTPNAPPLYHPFLLLQALEKYQESLKDLKAFEEVDPGNKACSREIKAVKSLYEKQLRELQTKLQAEKKPDGGTASPVPEQRKMVSREEEFESYKTKGNECVKKVQSVILHHSVK